MNSVIELVQPLPRNTKVAAKIRNISLRDISESCGYTRTSFSTFANQSPEQNISLFRFLILCNALGVSPGKLLDPKFDGTCLNISKWIPLYTNNSSWKTTIAAKTQIEYACETLLPELNAQRFNSCAWVQRLIVLIENRSYTSISLNRVVEACFLIKNLSFGYLFYAQKTPDE